MARFDDYICFVDESGDHSLQSIDPQYPVFVLAVCIFSRDAYISTMADVTRLKFKYFSHDQVILHEREIRRQTGPFSFLRNRDANTAFLTDLGAVVSSADMKIIASVIDKPRHASAYANPAHVYHIALAFCLERLYLHLKGCTSGQTTVVIEARGDAEDDQMELAFRRTCAQNMTGNRLPFEPLVVTKKSNSSGLQIADMVARPIGMHVLKPKQRNRAWTTIETKFRRSPRGHYAGWGLKVFP